MTEEEPTIREVPDDPVDEYTPPTEKEYEIDPSKLCEFQELQRISETEAKIIRCPTLADYRVIAHKNKKYLIEDGDPSNPRHWKSIVLIEYYCRKHFDQKYRYVPAPTPRISFKFIERK